MRHATPLLALVGLLAACAPEQPNDEGQGGESETPPTAAATVPGIPKIEPEAGRVSEYTRLDSCKLEERSPPGEGDFSSHVCPGLGGYGLMLTEGDLRQNLVVQLPKGGGDRSLKLSEVTASGGFTRLGESVEWRGRREGEGFRPDALILRYFVVENPDAPGKETPYLLTVSLGKDGPCVTGKLPPSPDQNEAARHKADGPMRCL